MTPIFHDDQHGTAIITNTFYKRTRYFKKINEVKIVINGAGASAQALKIYLKVQGKSSNIIMCDSKGVIYKGRKNIDQFKSAHAVKLSLEHWVKLLRPDVF